MILNSFVLACLAVALCEGRVLVLMLTCPPKPWRRRMLVLVILFRNKRPTPNPPSQATARR